MSNSGRNQTLNQRLEAIQAAYAAAVAAGQAPDRKELLAQHPDLAPELRAFFAEQDRKPQSSGSLAVPAPPAPAPGPSGLLQEGQIIRDTYEVERILGEGAFGEVYRVKHRFLGRQAMKVFKLVGMTIAEAEQLLGEALILSRIGHPNIIRVFEANTTTTARGQCGFFTMEYVPGGSLEKYWWSHGTQYMPLDTAVQIMCQVCQGLAVAHGENPPVIHRDVKPQNILVGFDGQGLRVRVSDFGLARQVNPLTLLASAKGTVDFKPPEIFRPWHGDSRAGDVWAIGCTLYLLLTDRMPYTEPNEDNAPHKRFARALVPASILNPQVDAGLDRILQRTLALNPEDRYPSARELLKDLEAWRPCPLPPAPPAPAGGFKMALGRHSPPLDENNARALATTAVQLARQAGRLSEAMELLEEAFTKCPDLRDEYEYQLKLWHRGIVM